jgi:multisubunit Na+/H+ antiporter MnhG subunit
VETGLVRAPDRMTRLHLEDVRARIKDTLDAGDEG